MMELPEQHIPCFAQRNRLIVEYPAVRFVRWFETVSARPASKA